MKLARWAHILSRSWLNGPMPERWESCRVAAVEAERIAPSLGADGELLIAAAYLHDVGSAPDLAVTGCSPLDGARYLLTSSGPARLAHLVAHQPWELRDSTLIAAIDEFDDEMSPLRDAFWYCLATARDEAAHLAATRYAS